jgi:tetratricopeptide (TPR) repeat protein
MAAHIAAARAILLFCLLCVAAPCHAQFEWLSGKPQEAARLKQEAAALNGKQRYAEALPLIEKATRLERELYGEQDGRQLDGLRVLSFTYYKLARYQEALAAAERRQQVSAATLGEMHPDSVTSLRDLAIAYTATAISGLCPCLKRRCGCARKFWARSIRMRSRS